MRPHLVFVALTALCSASASAQNCTTPPPNPANGTYASCTSVPSGSTCTLTCNAGYAKSGTEQTCQAGSYTGPTPTCVASFCTASPPNPSNGTYASCANVTVGGACALTCGAGYTRSGPNPTCVGGTTWSGAPTCTPNACTAPAPVANGTYAACTTVPSGSTCTLTCNAGYVKSGTEQTCQLGAYTGQAPTCVASFCTAPPANPSSGTYASCANVPVGG
ncbi:MAG: hypothetical protein IPJ65_33525, partial [Archangiaceae bacterium]|nr:hypothetical protein [Archangiaceae bacterium]